MSFRVLDALPILVLRYGATVNKVPRGKPREGPENKKVMGFRTSSGKVLALDIYPANLDRVWLWIEPPSPPAFPGLGPLDPKKCADLERNELRQLADGKGVYFEVESKSALEELLRWYS